MPRAYSNRICPAILGSTVGLHMYRASRLEDLSARNFKGWLSALVVAQLLLWLEDP